MRSLFRKRHRNKEIDPDEIFLDSANLPNFDDVQMEGRIEKPISERSVWGVSFMFVLVLLAFSGRGIWLQVIKGESYRTRAEENNLKHLPVLPERGMLLDRMGEELAWNATSGARMYTSLPGLAHVLGYLGMPGEEEISSGIAVYHDVPIGTYGAEKIFESSLRGEAGLKVAEVNAQNSIQSEHVFRAPNPGNNVSLSIDAEVQSTLYRTIESLAVDRGFTGGAGIIIRVDTGEVVALTSYPEFDSSILSAREGNRIAEYFKDSRKPFLNRALSGVYTPGSIVKPIVAIGALTEKIITPEHEILSTGKMEVKNPYNPKLKSFFTDWKAHGYVNMWKALAVSSNIYFYQVGGGYGTQKGIGISGIERYARLFGLGKKTGIQFEGEASGVVPNPAWKAENFDGDDWRIGDTYNTAIGQYGFGVTALQMVRAIAAIASNGLLVRPTIEKQSVDDVPVIEHLPMMKEVFTVVHEGMRQAVLAGTAAGLNVPYVKIGAKTGTAELGVSKQNVNSWVEGFFPYDDPKYAFVVVMESGKRTNTIGSVFVMRQMFDWMHTERPEMLEGGDSAVRLP